MDVELKLNNLSDYWRGLNGSVATVFEMVQILRLCESKDGDKWGAPQHVIKCPEINR